MFSSCSAAVSGARRGAMRPTGMMLVAPSDSQMPVPASATCIMCFAKSQAGWIMCWCAAVMLHGRGVVVGAEVRGDDAAAAFGDQPRQRDRAVRRRRSTASSRPSARAAACPAASPRQSSSASQADASAATCSGAVIFGSVTTKFGGSTPPVRVEQRGQEEVERAQAARACSSSLSGLMRMPMNGGSVPRGGAAATSSRRVTRVAVLFVVRAVAVAVLEVDAEVLDRLARQLVDDAGGRCARRGRDRAPSAAASVVRRRARARRSVRSASAPSFCAASALNRCAPP